MGNKIKHLLETSLLTLKQIAEQCNCSYKKVYNIWRKYPKTFRDTRSKQTRAISKHGEANPMFGKTAEQHPRFKQVVGDSKGYLMVLKPEWFTGRKCSHHVFQHSVVYCAANGMTEIPKGFVIHHCDQNPHNNVIENLIMMAMAEHARLHSLIGSATTISKESTAKWLEAERRGDTYDIVSSAQECVAVVKTTGTD